MRAVCAPTEPASEVRGLALSLVAKIAAFGPASWPRGAASADGLDVVLVARARLGQLVRGLRRKSGVSFPKGDGSGACATRKQTRPGNAGGTGFVFVIEHSLGHAVHGMNLENVLAKDQKSAELILLGRDTAIPELHLPVLRSWSFRASWAARRALVDRISAGSAGAVYIHTPVAALLCGDLMRRAPTVISMDSTPVGYDSLGADYGHRRQAECVEWVKLQVHRRIYSSAAALVTWSAWAAASLVDDYHIPDRRIHVIHPGVDLARFTPPATRPQGGRVNILFVGGDFERKGGRDLIEAGRRLGGAVELDLVTSSPPRSIPPDVTARVHCDVDPGSDALVDLYRSADVFALPSRGECYGLAISEAMACGLPVVACDVGGVSEMVVDGQNGVLVPPGNAARLADALSMLVRRPDQRADMGRAGLRVARRDHDAERNWGTILELMRRVSAQRRETARGDGSSGRSSETLGAP